MISLRTRLALTYSLFVGLLVVLLSVSSNLMINTLFSTMVKDNIAEQSTRIVTAMSGQYDPLAQRFSTGTIEVLGMEYVHQGYIVVVRDAADAVVWDARACDMEQCMATISAIAQRMQEQGGSGTFNSNTYALLWGGTAVGSVTIEAYAPYFYTPSEAQFINGFNGFLFWAGLVALALVVVLSVVLATTLARPVHQAAAVARRIAGGDLSARIGFTGHTRELRALSASVDELARALEEGDRWQKRLTSDVAHELRTPLTMLRGNLEAMRDGVLDPTPALIASCHEEAERLTGLVDELNRISLLEQENLALHRESFDLAVLVREVAASFAHEATRKGLDLRVLGASSTPCEVHADKNKVTQLVVNLLSNALAYTETGWVAVDVWEMRITRAMGTTRTTGTPQAAGEAGECCQLVVRDTGIGIAPADLAHIFDRFYRADSSRSRSTGGVGIGLSVVRAIVDAHGGTIEAVSTPTTGTTFTVTLPTR
jgi:signal transduction histidine kinase